jgi:hypothetical protein
VHSESSRNALDEDVEWLIGELRSGQLTRFQRVIFFNRLLTIAFHLRLQPELERLRLYLGVIGVFSVIEDEALVALIAPDSIDRDSGLQTLAQLHHDSLPETVKGTFGEASLPLMRLALSDEANQEFLKRQRERETRQSAEVRELLVEEDSRGQRLKEAAKQAIGYLWQPGGLTVGREELRAQAVMAIWENVAPLAEAAPRAGGDALLSYLDGSLNRVIDAAHEHVRNGVRTERRHRKALEAYAERAETVDSFDDGRSDSEGFFVEQVYDDTQSRVAGLLLEQVFQRAKLNDNELQLLEDYFFNEHSQEQIASRMQVNQSTVSRHLEIACEKLRKAAGQVPPQFSTEK